MAGTDDEEPLNLSLTENNTCLGFNRTRTTNGYVDIGYSWAINIGICIAVFIAYVYLRKLTDFYEPRPVEAGKEPSFFSIFKMNNERIRERCGDQAVLYLQFLRTWFFLLCVVMAVPLIIILPINIQGTLHLPSNFGYITINNLSSNSNLLWVHIIIGWILFRTWIWRAPPGLIEFFDFPSRTIMIENISKSEREDTSIQSILEERYNVTDIETIKFAYKIEKLKQLQEELKRMREAKNYCEENDGTFGFGSKDEAKTYYREKEKYFSKAVEKEKEKTLNEPLGIAFVTLNSEDQAKKLVTPYSAHNLFRGWRISVAPPASAINWENLECSFKRWVIKVLLLFSCVFLAIEFVLISGNIPHYLKNKFSVIEAYPMILGLVLRGIYYIDTRLPIWTITKSEGWLFSTKSSSKSVIMLFLLCTCLIFIYCVFPAGGITNNSSLIELLQPGNYTILDWQCFYMVDKSFFFFEILIGLLLMGTAVEFLRPLDVICYLNQVFKAKSQAERPSIRENLRPGFAYNVRYCEAVIICSICIGFSLICPLITIFGPIYMLTKYSVDKYNLYYVYKPSDMTNDIIYYCHHVLIFFSVYLAFILQQILLLGFFYIRGNMTCFWSCLAGFSIFYVVSLLAPTSTNSYEEPLSGSNDQYIAPPLRN